MTVVLLILGVWIADLVYSVLTYREVKRIRQVEEWIVGKGSDIP